MARHSTDWFSASDPGVYDVQTSAAGPQGALPFTDDMLR
jgi:hypothetical protein